MKIALETMLVNLERDLHDIQTVRTEAQIGPIMWRLKCCEAQLRGSSEPCKLGWALWHAAKGRQYIWVADNNNDVREWPSEVARSHFTSAEELVNELSHMELSDTEVALAEHVLEACISGRKYLAYQFG